MGILAAILGIILGISGFGFWKLLFSLMRCIASCVRIKSLHLCFSYVRHQTIARLNVKLPLLVLKK